MDFKLLRESSKSSKISKVSISSKSKDGLEQNEIDVEVTFKKKKDLPDIESESEMWALRQEMLVKARSNRTVEIKKALMKWVEQFYNFSRMTILQNGIDVTNYVSDDDYIEQLLSAKDLVVYTIMTDYYKAISKFGEFSHYGDEDDDEFFEEDEEEDYEYGQYNRTGPILTCAEYCGLTRTKKFNEQ